MCKPKMYWQVQTSEISKMAAIVKFINHRLSLVDTVQKKLLHDQEGDFSSAVLYFDEGLLVLYSQCKNASENKKIKAEKKRNMVAILFLLVKFIVLMTRFKRSW